MMLLLGILMLMTGVTIFMVLRAVLLCVRDCICDIKSKRKHNNDWKDWRQSKVKMDDEDDYEDL